MSVRKSIPETDGVYFITFTCAQWISLFQLTNSYSAIYKWFDYLKANGHFIIGYIIMPNHVHAIIAFHNSGKSINTIVGNGKRFMAYDIVSKLKEQKQDAVLQKLAALVNNTQKADNKKHEVFEPSFEWKECRTQAFTAETKLSTHECLQRVKPTGGIAGKLSSQLSKVLYYWRTGHLSCYQLYGIDGYRLNQISQQERHYVPFYIGAIPTAKSRTGDYCGEGLRVDTFRRKKFS